MAAALADILAIEAATLVTDAGLREIEDAMLAIANLPLTKERGDHLLRVIRAALSRQAEKETA
jgi:hypothetical protein